MSIELIAGILLAIKIIVFLAIILPMRKRLRFYTKKYLPLTKRLGWPDGKLNIELIHEIYNLIQTRSERTGDKGLHGDEYLQLEPNFHAVLDKHIQLHIDSCRFYEDILKLSLNLDQLKTSVQYSLRNDSYILFQRDSKLVMLIEKLINDIGYDKNSMEVFNGIQLIKKEIKEADPNLLSREFVAFSLHELEQEYLEKLEGSLLTTGLILQTAITVADFCGTVSRDDHAEIISRIENVITPILKQNFESTVLQKYPWIEDKK